MKTDDNEVKRKPRTVIILLLILIGLLLVAVILESFHLVNPFANPSAEKSAVAQTTPTSSPIIGTPTCPNNIQLSTPVGVNQATKLIVIVYDPSAKPIPGLDLSNGQRISDTSQFVSKVIPDLVKPGDEISVFRLGFDTYPAARVTRQYSYLTTYPQLYLAPTFVTLTPLPPTSIPTPGYGEVATKNAFRVVSTERAVAEAVNKANYDCEAVYYNENVKSTATAWDEMQIADVNSISTAEASDFATITPGRGASSELTYGGWYYGLYFASVDIKADCASYDECDLVLVGDLRVYRKNNPDNLPIALKGVNVYAIMPACRDINQPDCESLQSYWTSQLQGFGVNKITFWNGIRAEINLLGKIGR